MRISWLKELGPIREKTFGRIRIMEAAFDSISIALHGEDVKPVLSPEAPVTFTGLPPMGCPVPLKSRSTRLYRGENPMNEPSEPGIHEGFTTGTANRPLEAGYATPMSGVTARLREPAERENGVGYS